MERKEKVLIGIITNKDTLPIKVVPYFTVLFILKYKKMLFGNNFFLSLFDFGLSNRMFGSS